MKALAEGGLDPASILKFEEEKRQRQREEELLRIQEKHLLALLTRENAFTAKQSLLDDVKAHAESVRKEVMRSNVLSRRSRGFQQKLSEVFKFCCFVPKETTTLRKTGEMERESQQGNDGNRGEMPRNRASFSRSFQRHDRRKEAERYSVFNCLYYQ